MEHTNEPTSTPTPMSASQPAPGAGPERPGGATGVLAFFVIVMILLGIAASIFVFILNGGNLERRDDRQNASEIAQALAQMTIPEFEMRDHRGNAVTRADVFEGKWTVFGFVFTNCTLACPITTPNMIQLSRMVEDVPVRFVMISVDPEHDTPEVLDAYITRFGEGGARWSLLSPRDEEQVRSILNDGLMLPIDRNPDRQVQIAATGEMMNDIIHPTRFLLIGPDVRVRAWARGMEASEMEPFAQSIRALVND